MLWPDSTGEAPATQAFITARPVWDFDRQRIFLPLVAEQDVRAVARLDGVKRLDRLSRLGPFLGRIAEQTLTKFNLTQALVLDPMTGLFNRQKLLAELGRLLTAAAAQMSSAPPRLEVSEDADTKPQVALILVRILDVEPMVEFYGHRFLRRIVRHASRFILQAAGQESCPARLSETLFGWLEPGLSAEEAAANLARWAQRLEPLSAPNFDSIKLSLVGGVAAFPEDLPGPWALEGEEAAEELARELEERAGRALAEATALGPGHFLSLAEVKRRCGRVEEVLPLGRVVLSLGRGVGVEEGARYYVAHPSQRGSAVYKAELMVLSVNQDGATAEITALEDPRFPVQVGDRLALAEETGRLKPRAADERIMNIAGQEIKVLVDQATGLPGPRSLAPLAERLAEGGRPLAVLVVRVNELISQRALLGQKETDRVLIRLAELGQKILKPAAVCRAGVEALAFLITGADGERAVALGQELRRQALGRLEQTLSIGVAVHPFAGAPPSEAVDRALKALDHASFPEAEPVILFNAVSLNVSGDRLYHRGDVEGASQEYEKALAVDPDNVNVINSLGVCRGQMGRLEEAAELFERASTLAPEDFMGWYNLGLVRRGLGDQEQAKAALMKAKNLNQNDFAVLFALGQLHLDQGEANRAVEWFSQAAQADEKRPVINRWLGEALARGGRREEAMARFKKAVKTNPQDAASLSWLGRLYLDQENDKEIALSMARQSVELEPDNSLYRGRLGWALLINEHPEEALGQFQTALSKGERSPDLLRGLGLALAELNRLSEAEAALSEAAEAAPQDQGILNDLARIKNRGAEEGD